MDRHEVRIMKGDPGDKALLIGARLTILAGSAGFVFSLLANPSWIVLTVAGATVLAGDAMENAYNRRTNTAPRGLLSEWRLQRAQHNARQRGIEPPVELPDEVAARQLKERINAE
jgi:hypothetical protein